MHFNIREYLNIIIVEKEYIKSMGFSLILVSIYSFLSTFVFVASVYGLSAVVDIIMINYIFPNDNVKYLLFLLVPFSEFLLFKLILYKIKFSNIRIFNQTWEPILFMIIFLLSTIYLALEKDMSHFNLAYYTSFIVFLIFIIKMSYAFPIRLKIKDII